MENLDPPLPLKSRMAFPGCLVVMWPAADARAFSHPTSKAREKRPGDEVGDWEMAGIF